MGRGFRPNDEPPLTPLELEREKRRRVREKRMASRLAKGINRDLLEWLLNQRLELVGGSQSGCITITLRRLLIRTRVVMHQDLTEKPESIPISEIGPHGRRGGVYLPFVKL